jgi:NADPH-dependent 2,4-dienoyl-CoA reductase/sulfur reductase-like enzyme
MMNTYDIVVVGGGPAGLAAAVAAKQAGCDNVLILERDQRLGGILNQCIHNGFGLHTFKEELTGPEYAQRFIDRAVALGIPHKLNTMVLTINKDKQITYMNCDEGVVTIEAQAVILAMGCRERARGALTIPGSRPAGIYTAGTAQRLVNIEGYMPGKKVVILGSGDIGLIMARRLTLEGAEVKLVAEIMPYSGGLKRNIVQCLDDYGIPLQLSHTVIDIKGKERVEGVTIAEVDDRMRPIPGTEKDYACDTLLLSVGLIPENELSEDIGLKLEKRNGPTVNESLETSVPGIFACGNVLHVHDLVDYVSEEAENAGRCAVRYLKHSTPAVVAQTVYLKAGAGVAYTVPSTINVGRMPETLTVRFRVTGIYQQSQIGVYLADQHIQQRKKRVFSPGEMESIVVKRSDLKTAEDGAELTIGIEEVR